MARYPPRAWWTPSVIVVTLVDVEESLQDQVISTYTSVWERHDLYIPVDMPFELSLTFPHSGSPCMQTEDFGRG